MTFKMGLHTGPVVAGTTGSGEIQGENFVATKSYTWAFGLSLISHGGSHNRRFAGGL